MSEPHRFSTQCGCQACRRYDAWDTMCACFCVLVVLTVCPVTVLLVFAARGVGGTVGAWAMAGLLVASPVITWFIVRFMPGRKTEAVDVPRGD